MGVERKLKYLQGMDNMTHAQAPGKIILTGEHAVVYGRPALVMAVNRYVRTTIEPNDNDSVSIEFNAEKQPVRMSYSWLELRQLYRLLTDRQHQFAAGKISVNELMDNPFELIPYALISIFIQKRISSPSGMTVRIVTDIPIGCGMGSSASISLSILQAVAGFLGVTVDRETMYDMSCDCERLMHGITSGVDPYVCLHGGFIKFHRQQRTSLTFPKIQFQLVLTGAPASSTGECVMAVKDSFAESFIWDEFAAVASDIETALGDNNEKRLIQAIRQNHNLLTAIGVTPLKAQKFIREVESTGGAAKISGAGAVTGDNAGVLIVFGAQIAEELCRQYNYHILSISGDCHGVRLL
jgi:mevalonate kinase